MMKQLLTYKLKFKDFTLKPLASHGQRLQTEVTFRKDDIYLFLTKKVLHTLRQKTPL